MFSALRKFETLSAGFYVSVLCCAALAFGAGRDWFLACAFIFCFVSLSILLAHHLMNRLPMVRVPGALPLLMLAAWVAVQLAPLPAGVVAVISPATHAIYRGTVGIVEPLGWISLSLYSKVTAAGLFRLIGFIAFYVLSVQLLVHKHYLKTSVNVMTAGIALLAVVTFGFPSSRVVEQTTGILVMMLPVIVALGLFVQPMNRYPSAREWIKGFTYDRLLAIHALAMLAAGAAGWSIIRHSRAGLICSGISVCLLTLALIKAKGLHRNGTKTIALTAALLLLFGWLGWEPMQERFNAPVVGAPHERDRRADIRQDSLNIALDFPVTGTGVNTFGSIFPVYRTFTGNETVRSAHNDYLEFLVTGGGIAASLMMWFLVSLAQHTFPDFLRRRESYVRFIYLGALSGLTGIGLYSLFETNLQNGANGFYFFFLVGLIVSAAHTRLHVREKVTTLAEIPTGRVRRIFAPLLVAIIVVSLLHIAGSQLAIQRYRKVADLIADGSATAEQNQAIGYLLNSAMRLDPFDPVYPRMLAKIAGRQGDLAAADAYYRQSLRRSPLSVDTLQAYAQLLDKIGKADQAEQMFLSAIRLSRQRADAYTVYARWLIDMGRNPEGMAQMHTAMQREPERTRTFLDAMSRWGVPVEVMVSSIPDAAIPCVSFAQYLSENGNTALAEEYFRKSLSAASRATVVTAEPFDRIYRHYADQERWEEALQALQKGVEALPTDVGMRLALAKTYEKKGIIYRAIDEYRQALMLNPRDPNAGAALDRLTKSN